MHLLYGTGKLNGIFQPISFFFRVSDIEKEGRAPPMSLRVEFAAREEVCVERKTSRKATSRTPGNAGCFVSEPQLIEVVVPGGRVLHRFARP